VYRRAYAFNLHRLLQCRIQSRNEEIVVPHIRHNTRAIVRSVLCITRVCLSRMRISGMDGQRLFDELSSCRIWKFPRLDPRLLLHLSYRFSLYLGALHSLFMNALPWIESLGGIKGIKAKLCIGIGKRAQTPERLTSRHLARRRDAIAQRAAAWIMGAALRLLDQSISTLQGRISVNQVPD